MSKYIEAGWLIERIPSDEMIAMLMVLSKAPTIDIVHCRECKYKRIYDGETKYYYCALEDRPNRQWSVDETDYCSWGEREGE